MKTKMVATWISQIRLAIVLCSLIIFVFVSHGRDSLANRTDIGKPHYSQLQPSFRQRFVRTHSNAWDIGDERFRTSRNLRGIEEDELPVGQVTDHDLLVRVRAPIPEVYEESISENSGRNESIAIPVHQEDGITGCTDAKEHVGYPDSCSYVKAVAECSSGTLIEYTQLYYCMCSGTPILFYVVLGLWIVALFYMLGNTAADFFCCALEKLSTLLHLPPTVAGVTLLPLGNGAPDVFASIVAFIGSSGQGQVGLNSVLGGATFVSTVVAGAVSLIVASTSVPIQLDRGCFLRDMGFFLFTLSVLIAILSVGQIHFWWAIAYVSIYAAYAVTVAAVEFFKSHGHKLTQWHALQPLLSGLPNERGIPSTRSDDEYGSDGQGPYVEIVDNQRSVSSAVENPLPQWAWARHVAIYSHLDRQNSGDSGTGRNRPLWGWSEEQATEEVRWYSGRGLCSYFIEWPLTIPRRLTIPLVEELGWSKPYTVCTATFAPTLLAMVWDGEDSGPFGSAWKEYLVAGSIGILLGGISLFTLKKDRPPRRYLFPWAAGAFIMSIVWFYIVANELVAALVALGVVLEIDAAILGLTVLAWGNSIGDLMSNTALVYHGGDGVQIAFSGCYAGPMFNTLMGIGLSFVLASWKSYPAPFDIPQDDTIFVTLGFLVVGLVYSLYMMLTRRMEPSKPLGVGLLVLYSSFLTIRLVHALGFNSFMVVGDNR